MKKTLLPIAARLTVLSVLLVLFATVAADADSQIYFDGFYACDAGYYPNLQDCRGSINYPNNPTESQCRYNAGSTWQSCISSLYPSSPEEPDFCANARQARDHCIGQYGPNGADPDMMAYMTCYNGSGISQCE